MYLAFLVVPIERDANVLLASPVGGYFAVLFECLFEVEGMFFAFVFDTKIVHNQGELDGSSVMLPQSQHQLALVVAVLVHPFFSISLAGNPDCSSPYIPLVASM